MWRVDLLTKSTSGWLVLTISATTTQAVILIVWILLSSGDYPLSLKILHQHHWWYIITIRLRRLKSYVDQIKSDLSAFCGKKRQLCLTCLYEINRAGFLTILLFYLSNFRLSKLRIGLNLEVRTNTRLIWINWIGSSQWLIPSHQVSHIVQFKLAVAAFSYTYTVCNKL